MTTCYRNAFVAHETRRPAPVLRAEPEAGAARARGSSPSNSCLPTCSNVSEPLSVQLEFSVADVTASGAGKSVVSLPWVGNQLGVLRQLLGGAGLEQRKYPMQTWVTYGLKETISLKVGPGFGEVLSLPACSPVEDDCLDYHQAYSLKDGSLDCSREFKLKVVEFSPSQYPAA